MRLTKEHCAMVFEQLGESRKMVLSTSCKDHVTSRMMSVIIIDGLFYFQTDKMSRKCQQIIENARAALCIDNVQVEGVCEEIGIPSEHQKFCTLYKRYFPGSYERYTSLSDERLFCLKPAYIKRWIYEGGEPYEEVFDFRKESYEKRAYVKM